MVNTAAIVIIIIAVILLLVALGVGLYFYFKDRNKKTPDTGSGGGNDPVNSGNTQSGPGTNNPPSNPLPPPTPAGPSGSTGPPPSGTSIFAVAPDIESRPFSGVWAPNSNSKLVISPTDSSQPCNNYLFEYANISTIAPVAGNLLPLNIENALIWQGDKKTNVIYASNISSGTTGTVSFVDYTFFSIPDTDAANWSYNTNNKSWCLTKYSNRCLYYDQSSQSVFIGDLTNDRIFQWDYGTLPSNYAPCKT